LARIGISMEGVYVSVEENLACIRQSLQGYPVKIVAVTKNQSVDIMRAAIDAGITAIGENRVQEAQYKFTTLNRQVEWHLVGHLQTNKVRHAVKIFDLIHSVDSERLAAAIDRAAGQIGKRQDVLIQVNIGGEVQKLGIPPEETLALARVISQLPNIRLCGLMTIAPLYENPEDARPLFRRMYQLFQELKAVNLPNTDIQWLSMGMTNDYRVAVEEGANMVRIGTGIFGPRNY